MKETTLYSAFTCLEKNGYIESYFGKETQGKRRTYYRIAPDEIKYYKEKCEERYPRSLSFASLKPVSL